MTRGPGGSIQTCYVFTLAGKVQDAGFSILIEDIARLHGIKGYAFNDTGTVKMVCGGENGVISDFLQGLRTRGKRKGIIFNITDKKEYSPEIRLAYAGTAARSRVPGESRRCSMQDLGPAKMGIVRYQKYKNKALYRICEA